MTQPKRNESSGLSPVVGGSRWDQHALGRPLLIALTYNNGKHASNFFRQIPKDCPFDVLIHDDKSTDDTAKQMSQFPFELLVSDRNRGIGGSIKNALKYAKENGYQVVAIAAANGKDSPLLVERLLEPIYEDGVEYVQGSRRLKGGNSEKLPLFRKIMIPMHALLFQILTWRKCTDTLNGFRAYRLDLVFNHPKINVWQDWLDKYEYETYLHYKVLRYGVKFQEVPVEKSYSQFKKGEKYSHIRPIIDWWSNIKPLLYLFLGIRK